MMERIESSIRRCPVSRFLLSPRSLHLSSSFSSTRHPLPLRLSPYSRLVLVKDSKEIEKKNLLPAKKVRQGERRGRDRKEVRKERSRGLQRWFYFPQRWNNFKGRGGLISREM